MSEASRAAALAHAALVHQGSGDGPATLETAEAFHAFIAPAADAAPAKPVKAATTPTKAPAPVKKKAVAPPPVEDDAAEEEETEEAGEEGAVTKESVGDAIEALLNANLRDKAMGLFKKYKAKSLSGVKAEDYAAIKQDADDILMANA